MLYALLCYSDEAVVLSRTKAEDDALIAKRHRVTDPLAARGKLGATIRLMPTTAATTVRMGRERVVLDGPFAETKEALLGLYVVDCASLDEAIALAQQVGRDEKVVFEIRPLRFYEPQGTFKLRETAV